MKAVLSARSRSYRGAPRRVLYGLLALVSIGASTAIAQSGLPAVASAKAGGALVHRLDSYEEYVEKRNLRAACHDALDVLQQLGERPAPRLRAWAEERHQAVREDSHGIKFIGHDGGGFGFSSQTRWYPDARMAVVVLTNSEPLAPNAGTRGPMLADPFAPIAAGSAARASARS
jgi:hypothetical protein